MMITLYHQVKTPIDDKRFDPLNQLKPREKCRELIK
jgi:hypothetical protein